MKRVWSLLCSPYMELIESPLHVFNFFFFFFGIKYACVGRSSCACIIGFVFIVVVLDVVCQIFLLESYNCATTRTVIITIHRAYFHPVCGDFLSFSFTKHTFSILDKKNHHFRQCIVFRRS